MSWDYLCQALCSAWYMWKPCPKISSIISCSFSKYQAQGLSDHSHDWLQTNLLFLSRAASVHTRSYNLPIKSQMVFHSSLLTLVNGAPDQDLYWEACGRSILCCCIYLSSNSICNHAGCNKNLLGILSLQETRQSTLRSGKHIVPQGSIAQARADL